MDCTEILAYTASHSSHLNRLSEVDLNRDLIGTWFAAGPGSRHVTIVHELDDVVCSTIFIESVRGVSFGQVGHAGKAGVGQQSRRVFGIAEALGQRSDSTETAGVLCLNLSRRRQR